MSHSCLFQFIYSQNPSPNPCHFHFNKIQLFLQSFHVSILRFFNQLPALPTNSAYNQQLAFPKVLMQLYILPSECSLFLLCSQKITSRPGALIFRRKITLFLCKLVSMGFIAICEELCAIVFFLRVPQEQSCYNFSSGYLLINPSDVFNLGPMPVLTALLPTARKMDYAVLLKQSCNWSCPSQQSIYNQCSKYCLPTYHT